jgi:hypothetical protein
MAEVSISKRRYNRVGALELAFNALEQMEVVGLESSSDGRSCNQHLCCGQYIRKNDKLVCQWQMQAINSNTPEAVVQVYALNNDGLPSCHVGYIPKRYFKKFGVQRFQLMFLRVKTDYRVSLNSMERHRSHYNYGMVLCEIIKDNNNYNGHDPFNGDACDVSVVQDDPDIMDRGVPAEPAESKKKAKNESETTSKKKKAKVTKTNNTNKPASTALPEEVTINATMENKEEKQSSMN